MLHCACRCCVGLKILTAGLTRTTKQVSWLTLAAAEISLCRSLPAAALCLQLFRSYEVAPPSVCGFRSATVQASRLTALLISRFSGRCLLPTAALCLQRFRSYECDAPKRVWLQEHHRTSWLTHIAAEISLLLSLPACCRIVSAAVPLERVWCPPA
jgi:hypothetical protein